MNTTLKTVLLTVLTLSVFTIALVELSGVSQTALFNKFKEVSSADDATKLSGEEQSRRDDMVKKMKPTTMVIPDSVHDFGKIKEGSKVRHTWHVRNTGTEPLMISNIRTSCGCTAPYFSREPIMPGQEGEVTLVFSSAGKNGQEDKKAHIIANTDNSPYPIGFTVFVEK